MEKKDRIQKIIQELPKRFYFEKSFEMPDRNKILKDINLCYKKSKSDDLLNCSPLLTKEQEFHIFRKLNYLKYRLLKTTKGFEKSKDGPKFSKPVLLERLKENSLREIESIIKNIQETRNIIIKSNLRLVFKRVQKYYSSNTFEKDEFFSNGYHHLIKAVDYFDYRLGYKFSTYCTKVIITGFYKDYAEKRKHEEKLTTENISFGVEDDFSNTNFEYNKVFIKKLLKKIEDSSLNNAHVKKKIILEYYGIDRDKGKSLEQIGNELKITRERVRQIKNETIKYLVENCSVYDPMC
jgi:RNA polymerase sigma factor (sigma-70 family)